MIVDMVMPFLSETTVEGTVTRWLKQPGDRVEFGDELVEIETDKVTTVYQSDTDGVLIELVVAEGTTVPCGQTIARIDSG